jgi:hypothetical protein
VRFYICGSAARQFWRGDLLCGSRDFQGWHPVRGVLIASVVGLAVNILVNVVATVQGWLNANAWGSIVVLVLLLLGGIYQLMVGPEKNG